MVKKNLKTSNKSKSTQSKKRWSYMYVFSGIICMVAAYIYSLDSTAKKLFDASHRFQETECQNVSCSSDYKEHPIFEGCTPMKTCSRCVRDGLVTSDEVNVLLKVITSALKHGGSDGGASILDLHSGAMSKGTQFINIYKYLDETALSEVISETDLQVYVNVKNRVHRAISDQFGINPDGLYLTKPTFFSRINSDKAKTQHDEYWHNHIDKLQYGSFDYTSLLYLTTHDSDFKGGRFMFDANDKDSIIEPRAGRISFFTSGSENPHHVEKVKSGTRYALTIAFTCDPKKAISDPTIHS